MNNHKDSHTVETRFLLGELAEAEQLAVEEKAFSDAEYFERLCAVENDLIDRYARNRLSHSERERFERHYLTTPDRRQRVAFARSLARATTQTQTAQVRDPEPAAKPLPWWQALLATLRGAGLVGQLATAMCLLLLVGGIWATLEITRLRRDLLAVNQERILNRQREEEIARRIQELQGQIATSQSERDAMAKELDELRRQQRELESPQPVEPKPSVLAFVLNPGATRAGSEAPVLKIDRAAESVRLHVNLDGTVDIRDYASYQALFRTVEGTAAFTQQARKAQPIKNGAIVILSVPAQKLTRADYILTLSGVKPAGEIEELDKYFFRVEKR
jgi:hypothetical protein